MVRRASRRRAHGFRAQGAGMGTVQLLALLSASSLALSLALQAHAVLTEQLGAWAAQLEALHHLRNLVERTANSRETMPVVERRTLYGKPWYWACHGATDGTVQGRVSVVWTCSTDAVQTPGRGWVLSTQVTERARAY